MLNRNAMRDRLDELCTTGCDLVVIGGGATGVGVAIDAAARGYTVALFEQADFGKGTSSRSTKLIHGGVRYLQQGNIPLVMEALKERGMLRANAPHLVHELPFVVPNYQWWEAPFYGIGMRVYDALAGRYGFGDSRNLSWEETVARIPTIETRGLRGGVLYHDGQFDDARLLVHMAMTAAAQGAMLLNQARVSGLVKDPNGYITGVRVHDLEADDEIELRARVVVNCTGVFADAVRRLDEPDAPAVIRPSQGVHIVLDRAFLPGDAAIMVPHTDDGRVMFAIPWHDRVLIGTTDTPVDDVDLEPRPLADELRFLLEHAIRYLTRDPAIADIRSVFTGLRPLFDQGDADTAAVSREHAILVSHSGLVTVAGGKWTTYRKMAEDTVDHAATLAGLEPRPCPTHELRLYGWIEDTGRTDDAAADGRFGVYGSDAAGLNALIAADPDLGRPLHPELSVCAAQIIWGVRHEMARTVDDVLARRTRALLFDARAALAIAPRVAAIMADELGRDESWQRAQVAAFGDVAEHHIPG